MTQIIKLHDKAQQPILTPSGLDIFSVERVDIEAGHSYSVGSGLSIVIPEGYVGLLFPRGKMAMKKNTKIAAQVIHHNDSSEIKINLNNDGNDLVEIKFGETIAQLVVIPYYKEYSFVGF